MVDIYDMEGVRWGQMSSGMRLLSGVLSVAQDHYPENLSQAFLVNVPGFFAGSWRLISAAIDKNTQQKIVISKDGGTDALDAVLGWAPEFASRPGSESVWRTGDEWLGGGSDEVAQISAKSGWVHKVTLEVLPDSGRVGERGIGQATWIDTGRRLFWYFHIEGEWRSHRHLPWPTEAVPSTRMLFAYPAVLAREHCKGPRAWSFAALSASYVGCFMCVLRLSPPWLWCCVAISGAAPVDFGVTFTPATQGARAQESQSNINIQVYPTTSCTGRPVRGCLDDVRPGTYVLVWESQPGRRARPHKLKRRCWLGSVDQETSFVNLLCARRAGHSNIQSENAFAQAIEPGSPEEEAPLGSTSSIAGVVSNGDPERRDRPEKTPLSSSRWCSNDEDSSTDELASRRLANSANELRLGESSQRREHQDMPHCDDDGQRNVARWCWSATLCAGVGVGSLLCARVLHSSSTT